MRIFLRNLTIFLLSHLCVWALVVWSYSRQRPFNIEFNAIVNDKQELLKQQVPPRIILVGGSNLNFGINSPEIERRTGFHPINMGLNVGDGLGFMLKNTVSRVKPGDVVVLSPEYEYFGDLYNGKAEFLYAEVEHRPSMIGSFTAANLLVMLDGGYIIAGNILRYTLQRRGDEARRLIETKNHVYRRDAFNKYGDLVDHYKLDVRLQRSDIVVGPANVNVTPEKITRAIDGLNAFDTECKSKGVRVFYSFPPVPHELFDKHGAVIREIADQLRGRLEFPILDTPEEMSFAIENFFDGVYHLTEDGTAKRTSLLIDRLVGRGVMAYPFPSATP